jgi:hypothetical protein
MTISNKLLKTPILTLNEPFSFFVVWWSSENVIFLRTTKEIIIMFNVSSYWNFLVASSLSVAPMPHQQA